MAECVSCGKEIPQGKFFCDDCYTKMKGRRRPLGEVSRISTEGQEAAATGGGGPVEEEAAPEQDTVPAEAIPPRKASDMLTPTSGKKVVSIKPPVDKTAKDKAGPKRFAVTITFSERTYAAFERLKTGKGKKAQALQDTEGAGGAAGAEPSGGKSGKGPLGKPQLKAVDTSSLGPKRRGGFMGAIGYRDRPADRGDITAAVIVISAVLMIVVMSFLPWAEISLGGEEAEGVQAVRVPGIDLGAITYLCIALAVAALLYMVATWMFKGFFTIVDYGVVFIVAGVIFIPLFYTAISSNTRFVAAAMEQLGMGQSPVPDQFQRQTLWPAYIMVIAGAAMAFSGLIRLSDRRSG